MSLLSLLGQSTGDKAKDDAINQGLLQAGLALMNSRGNFAQSLGQGGMAGLYGYNQAQDRQFQMKQRDLQQKQMEDQARQLAQQQQIRDASKQFYRSPTQTTLAGGGGPTVENAQKLQDAKPSFDWEGYVGALEGIDPMLALQLRGSLAKDNTELLSEGQARFDKKTGKQIYGNPKSSDDALTKLIRARDSLPPGDPNRATYDAAIQKQTTHSPGVTVANYGAPVPVQLPDGTTALVQPSNRPGAPPQLMRLPGTEAPLRPAKDPGAEKPLTESQAKAAAYLDQMRSASKTHNALGFDSNQVGNQAQVAMARNPMGSALVSPEAQQVKQAQDQWSESFLRFKTGAAATPAEVELNNKTFFPQPGDKAAVVKQKAEARRQAEHSVSIAAGKGESKTESPGSAKPVKRTGTYQGKKVIEYEDGSVEYQN